MALHGTARVRSPEPLDVIQTSKQSLDSRTEDGTASASISSEVIAEHSGIASKRLKVHDQDHDHDHDDPMEVDILEPEQEKGEDLGDQDEDGSDKKKNGQRFYCTGYPPCNLSFTRSEHLARHIRKHTGERPFQCHCSRRFSRLDNLRQHAQTVHVNEEIPNDSLAATGTRYQRQIRTDRVRPPPRPRTSTTSSAGSHSRGHSRNLSTSSIGSTISTYSTTADGRRRPPPLLMTTDGSMRPATPPTQYSAFAGSSPGDISTPMSTTYSAAPESPSFSVLGSPMSNTSHMASTLIGARTPMRRLSVPSSTNTFSQQFGGSYFSGSASGGAVFTGHSGGIMSPTGSTFSQSSAYYSPSGEDWRRRTWHAPAYTYTSYGRPATSGLSYSQTPDAPQPAFNQNATAAAGGAPRLPGIESFDNVPSTPHMRRGQLGPFGGASLLAAPDIEGHRRNVASWDGTRRVQYSDLDEHGRAGVPWGQQSTESAYHVRSTRAQAVQPAQSMGPPPFHPSPNLRQTQQIAQEALSSLQAVGAPKRHNPVIDGPGPAVRTSPEDSSSSDGIHTPKTSAAEINPAIVNSAGYIEPQLLSGDAQHSVSRGKPLISQS